MAHDNYFWYPDTPPVFEGGRQPYEQLLLTQPSTDLPKPDADTDVNLRIVREAWEPPPPSFVGGLQPYAVKLGVAAILAVTAVAGDNPPGHARTNIQIYSQQRALPQTAPKFPFGAVTVTAGDNPPPHRVSIQFHSTERRVLPQRAPFFTQAAAAAVTSANTSLNTILGMWQPPDLPPVQRYARVVISGVAVGDNPPSLRTNVLNFTVPTRLPVQLSRIQLNPALLNVTPTADNPPPHRVGIQFHDSGRRLLPQRSPFYPLLAPVTPDNPPFVSEGRSAWVSSIIAAWQPPDPLPTLPGKLTQPSTNSPPRFHPWQSPVQVTDPQPTQRYARVTAPSVIVGDNPPPRVADLLVYDIGRRLLPQRSPFYPVFTPVPGNNPPFRSESRWPQQNSIIASWQPPDPLPTLTEKSTPPSGAAPATGDNPPGYRTNVLNYTASTWPWYQQRQNKRVQPGTVAAGDNPPPHRVAIQFHGAERRLLPQRSPFFPTSGTAPAAGANPPGYRTNVLNYTDSKWPWYHQRQNKIVQPAAGDNPPFGLLVTVTEPWLEPSPHQQARSKRVQPGTAVGSNPPPHRVGIQFHSTPTRVWIPQRKLNPALLNAPTRDNPPSAEIILLTEPWLENQYRLPQTGPKFPHFGVPAPTVIGNYPPAYHTDIINYTTVNRLPQPLGRKLNPSILNVIPDNPPRFRFDISGILRTWIPPDPQPQVTQKSALTPPTTTPDNPPFVYEGRWSEFNSIILSWQPPDPLPTLTTKFTPPTTVSDNPPFRYVGRWPFLNSVIASWQPPDPLPTLTPKFAPPSTTAGDNPPRFRFDISGILLTWQPPDPLPTLTEKLTPSLISVPAPNPPGYRTNVLNFTVPTWSWYQLQRRPTLVQPGIVRGDNPFAYHTDIINYASLTQFPYQQRQNKVVQPGTSTQVDNPPFGLLVTVFEPWIEPPAFQQKPSKAVIQSTNFPPRFRFDLSGILRTWQPPDPQPFQRGPLNPSRLAVFPDNPPFVNPGRWKQAITVRSSWDPPDPQPTQRGPLAPFILNVTVDNPPFRYPGRWPQFNSIIASWQAPDPQPTTTQKSVLIPPLTIGDNPPFVDMGRWKQFITITSSWEPPLAYQPTLPPKSTPPSGPPGPPVTTGEFTVSGWGVHDRFPVYDVSYTYAPITKRTN